MSFINPSKWGTPLINAPHQWTSWVRPSRGAFIIRDGENYLCNCYSGSVNGHWSRPLLAWEVSSLLNQRTEAAVYYPALTLRMHISYQLLCNKLSQNIMAWKNNEHVLFHTVFMDQEFGSSYFWMKVSPEIVVKMPVTSKMAYTEVDAGSWPETSIPCHIDLSLWLPKYSHNITASFPRTSHLKKTRWKPQCLLWPSLRSHSPSFLQYPIGDTRQIFHRGKGLHRAWMPGSEIHWVHPGSGAFDSS